MNWNRHLTLLALSLGLLVVISPTTPVLADGPIAPPAVKGAALLNWSGFYIGGNAGGIWGDYGYGDSSIDVTLRQPRRFFPDGTDVITGPGTVVTVDVPAFTANSGGEFIGGVQLGYNRQFGSWVFGLEGDATGLSLAASKSFTLHSDMLDLSGLSSRREASSDWLLTGRVRFGYAWQRILFYGTGGLAVSNMDVSAHDFYAPTVAGERSSSDNTVVAGWTGGGGVEFAVSDAVSIAAEYRHTGFGDQNFDFSSDSRFMVHSTHVDLNEDQVTLRVNIRVDSLFHR
jgi:outer membrane immunogenic protein